MQARMSGCLRFLNHLVLGEGERETPSYSSFTAFLGTHERHLRAHSPSPASSSLQKAACCLHSVCLAFSFGDPRLPRKIGLFILPALFPCGVSLAHRIRTHCIGTCHDCSTYLATLCMDWLSLICSKSLIIKHRQIYSLSDENLNIYRLQVCPLNEFYLPINKAVTSLSGIDITCLSTISLKSQSESGQGRYGL